jgi:hypothetical protein
VTDTANTIFPIELTTLICLSCTTTKPFIIRNSFLRSLYQLLQLILGVNDSQSYEKKFSHAIFVTVAMCLEVTVANMTLIGTAATVSPMASASVSALPSDTDVSGGSTLKSPTWMREQKLASSSADSVERCTESAFDYDLIRHLSNSKSGVVLTYLIKDSLDLKSVQAVLSNNAGHFTEALVQAGYLDAMVSNVVSVTVLDSISIIQKKELSSGAIATIALAGIAVAFMMAVCCGKKHSKVADALPGTRI